MRDDQRSAVGHKILERFLHGSLLQQSRGRRHLMKDKIGASLSSARAIAIR